MAPCRPYRFSASLSQKQSFTGIARHPRRNGYGIGSLVIEISALYASISEGVRIVQQITSQLADFSR